MTTVRIHVASRSGALLSASVLMGLALVLGVVYSHNPAGSTLLPPCPFRAATQGLLCPGCGTLRGLHQLLHGNLAQAFSLNALMVLSIPFFGYLGLAALWSRRRRPAPGWTRPRHLAWVTLAVICLWWVARNVLLATG